LFVVKSGGPDPLDIEFGEIEDTVGDLQGSSFDRILTESLNFTAER